MPLLEPQHLMQNSSTKKDLENLCGQIVHWTLSLAGSRSWHLPFAQPNKVTLTTKGNYSCLNFPIIKLEFFIHPFYVTDCDSYFKRSLFLVGEIGGNDYNYAFFAGGNITQLQATVPLVVEAITKTISVCYINQTECTNISLNLFRNVVNNNMYA